ITGIAQGAVIDVTSQGSATGIYVESESTSSGVAYGVRSYTTSSTSSNYAVWGEANASSSFCYGGRFISTATGSHTAYGVYGRGTNSFAGSTYGVYGSSSGSGTGTHYGVFGYEASGGSGAAVYASGDLIASGSKSAVVKTSEGPTLLYAMESPENWFEDFGSGQLVNGRAHIELDELFLETVTISEKHPLKVFIQLNDDCNGTYVKTTSSGFDVFELQNGTNSASFTYRVVAKRKGFEEHRLESTTVGYWDEILYPERAEEIQAHHETLGQSETE
ncbi:MAG: hypothetical protein V3T31_07540, partial [candidate division Zixibacteria bacterium]